jgi:hypothetical protein
MLACFEKPLLPEIASIPAVVNGTLTCRRLPPHPRRRYRFHKSKLDLKTEYGGVTHQDLRLIRLFPVVSMNWIKLCLEGDGLFTI